MKMKFTRHSGGINSNYEHLGPNSEIIDAIALDGISPKSASNSLCRVRSGENSFAV